jgi:Sulfotransferase domain
MKLANFILAGVNKAGSTSLFHYLTSHPQICGSRDKETCYFLPLLYNENIGPISNYEKQFVHCENVSYRMESTPAYMFGGKKIADNIKNTLGDIKVLIILKDPVERVKAFYTRKKSTLQLPREITFSKYVDKCMSMSEQELSKQQNQIYTGIHYSLYHNYIESWFDVFGKNLKVVFFDNLLSDPHALVSNICHWLDVDAGYYDNFNFDIKNKSVDYKLKGIHRAAVTLNNTGQKLWRMNPGLKSTLLKLYYNINGKPFDKLDLDEGTINRLYSYFSPHNRELFRILDKKGVQNMPDWLIQDKITK